MEMLLPYMEGLAASSFCASWLPGSRTALPLLFLAISSRALGSAGGARMMLDHPTDGLVCAVHGAACACAQRLWMQAKRRNVNSCFFSLPELKSGGRADRQRAF